MGLANRAESLPSVCNDGPKTFGVLSHTSSACRCPLQHYWDYIQRYCCSGNAVAGTVCRTGRGDDREQGKGMPDAVTASFLGSAAAPGPQPAEHL